VVFVKNVAETLFKKESKETPIPTLKPETEVALFKVSHLIENINFFKCYDLFLVFLISLNVNVYIVIVYFVVGTPLQQLKKNPKTKELNLTSIVYKLAQYFIFGFGVLNLMTLKTLEGNDVKLGITVGLFLCSELIDVFYFHNISELKADVEVLIGQSLIFVVAGIYFQTNFENFLFFSSISLITSTISLVPFVLFVIGNVSKQK
jgi:hypothetical protein